MDSSKTIYPGMPISGNPGRDFSEKEQNNRGTYYPAAEQQNNKPAPGGKPLVGFLYSVSKTMLGEYWPLRAGSNPIGRSSDSSVCLRESTVSDKHANLVIRQMHNEDGSASILAFIQDLGSTCGTMVNGVSLGFDPKECKNGDVITIGENYELYFILIDRLELNLFTKDGFIPAQEAAPMSGVGFMRPMQPMQPMRPMQQPMRPMQPMQQPMGPMQPMQQPMRPMQPMQQQMGPMQPMQQPMQPMQQPIQPNGGRLDNATYANSSPFSNQKSTIYMPNKK